MASMGDSDEDVEAGRSASATGFNCWTCETETNEANMVAGSLLEAAGKILKLKEAIGLIDRQRKPRKHYFNEPVRLITTCS